MIYYEYDSLNAKCDKEKTETLEPAGGQRGKTRRKQKVSPL